MQHYGLRTNLMDWSEDAFTSLFFSLYNLISNKKRDAYSDAAIYIFSPHLYNDARKHMIKKCAETTSCTEAAYKLSNMLTPIRKLIDFAILLCYTKISTAISFIIG